MPALLIAFTSGLVFGLGLLVSGMNNPAKVRGFLDLAGDWQPALIAVMGGAVVVFAIAYRFSRQLSGPWHGDAFHEPSLRGIDTRLIAGAILFGIGWGLVGLCPGPALVDLASFDPRILGFFVMVLVGNRIAHRLFGPVRS